MAAERLRLAAMQGLLASGWARVLDGVQPWRRPLREASARWGQPGNGDQWMASRYFGLVRDADDPACVDTKTWGDLELPALFATMDTCATPVGSQVLFAQLRTRVADAGALAARRATYAALQADADLRTALLRQLVALRHDHHARIADFIFGAPPAPLNHQRLLHAWVLASLAVLAAAFIWPPLAWAWLAMVLVSVVTRLQIGISGRTLRDIETLRTCLRLARVADRLARLPPACGARLPQLAALQAERSQRARLARALGGLLVWNSWSAVFPISILVGVLNFTCLADVVLHAHTMRRFARLRHALAASFAEVGALDAALAVASWLTCVPRHCVPELTAEATLDVREARHPLLPAGVPNSIRLVGRSLLVTGSNMAGKTTFIKMLAVNVLLAQTLGFCTTAAATVPRAHVRASIQAAHSVASGKSHYFSEVETIRGFLQPTTAAGRTLLILDEPFSGTNTIERVAIAHAVLDALARDAMVLATTHDVELQGRLGDRFELCHFQENPDVEGYFDYRLRPGAATERNAIRLLAEVGFPAAVIAAAMVHADAGAQAAADAPAERARAAPRDGPRLRSPDRLATLGVSPLQDSAMPRQAIHSDSAPKAIGPYSQGVRAGNTLYLSGQIPIDPATGEVVAGDVTAQATRVFENLKAVLAAAGASFDDVQRVAIYMPDLGNFGAVNAVMQKYFREPYPARSTLGVAALPKGVAVEIDVIATAPR